MKRDKIGVIGGGSWGTTLALHSAREGGEVKLWAREKEIVESINKDHINPVFLNGFRLPDNLIAADSFEGFFEGMNYIIWVTPAQHLRKTMESALPFMKNNIIHICASKGIENESLMRVSEIAEYLIGENNSKRVFILSGPSFAKGVAKGDPTAIVIAGNDSRKVKNIQTLLSHHGLRLYASPDRIGVELGGALKNVIAIACGIAMGIGFGANTQSAIITRGLAEIIRFAHRLGARKNTLSGLSGMGDLVLTCTGGESRNRSLGIEIGKGGNLNEILSKMVMVAEGVPTAKSAFALSVKYDVDMPITKEVYNILFENKLPKVALMDLLSRNLTKE